MDKCIKCPAHQMDDVLNKEFDDGWRMVDETFRVVTVPVKNGAIKDAEGNPKIVHVNYLFAILRKD